MVDHKLQITLIELLKDGHQVEVPAQGISMYPLLQPGDKLIVQPTPPQIGDIGVFSTQNTLIAHRLIKVDKSLYYFKGDGLIHADNPTVAENVLGTVVARKRRTTTDTNSHFAFKLFKKWMPKFTFITGRPFHYYGRIHHKLSGKKKSNH